jgi:hypothetical protein
MEQTDADARAHRITHQTNLGNITDRIGPLVSGTMGQPIALNLGIVPNGLAGDSNSLSSAKISGIPSGTTLGNANGDTLIVSAGSVTFSAGQLAAGALNGLAITPASSGSFSLTVAATEQDAQGYPQHHRHQQ